MNNRSDTKILPINDSRESKFRSVFNELFDPLFIYARSLTKSDDLAKDAVSEVFLNLWATNSNLDGIHQIKAYLLVCVRNECLKQIYQTSHSDEQNSIEQIDKISPEDILLEKELKERLDIIVSTLPDKCRLVFELSVVKKKSHNEVAKELGISVSTVSTQLANALRAIRIEMSSIYDSKSSDSFRNIMLVLLPLIIILV